MAILLDERTTLVIQGITGREGSARTRFMLDYGARVVAGVTPGRGGSSVAGVPVYDTLREACRRQGAIDAAVVFVPGNALKDAVLEAIDAGIPRLFVPGSECPCTMLWRWLPPVAKEACA